LASYSILAGATGDLDQKMDDHAINDDCKVYSINLREEFGRRNCKTRANVHKLYYATILILNYSYRGVFRI
jgi:hypothetical protein